MKHIDSRDNAQFKQLVRLVDGKDAGFGLVLEGIHLCRAWLRHVGRPMQAIFDAARLQTAPELAELAADLPDRLCMSCAPRLARRLSQVENGQGVYFVVKAPAPAVPEYIDHNGLWLDRVQDPGNLGTLLRTAAAAGIRHAYLSSGCASAWSQKTLRSAQGAHFVMAIHEQLDLLAECGKLKVPLIAAALGQAQSLYSEPLPETCVWLLGNEGQGVDASLLQRADRRVFIPQTEGVESLNVAAAAAICLFEQRRQCLSRIQRDRPNKSGG
ncbi:MAG TPA: RNA methyltransferase [Paralcaligenes sp.]|jgi:TrmH family RNA methyltransferase